MWFCRWFLEPITLSETQTTNYPMLSKEDPFKQQQISGIFRNAGITFECFHFLHLSQVHIIRMKRANGFSRARASGQSHAPISKPTLQTSPSLWGNAAHAAPPAEHGTFPSVPSAHFLTMSLKYHQLTNSSAQHFLVSWRSYLVW